MSTIRALTREELEHREAVARLLWETDRNANDRNAPWADQRQAVKNIYSEAAWLAMQFLATYDDHGGMVDLVRCADE